MTDTRRAARVASIRALGVLAEPPAAEHTEVARALGLSRPPENAEHTDVFLFNLVPYASVYLGEEGMIGGDTREAIAGFWRAVGQTPPAEPDHLTALLGLYAGLLESEQDLEPAEHALAVRSRAALLHEHMVPWIFAYLDRVAELSPPLLTKWAQSTHEVLRQEVEDLSDSTELFGTAPRCLEVGAKGLSDPRITTTGDFLQSLLAPVRCGVIVTRADLARVARSSGLALRAGERRYALEHLMQQDAPNLLAGLGEEAARQATMHEDRSWCGVSSDVLAGRARGTATLLAELAREARDVVEAVP